MGHKVSPELSVTVTSSAYCHSAIARSKDAINHPMTGQGAEAIYSSHYEWFADNRPGSRGQSPREPAGNTNKGLRVGAGLGHAGKAILLTLGPAFSKIPYITFLITLMDW